MKKLYRKGTVHPSPPIISDHLSFLPAAILTLTLALSPQDREVLAYLISSNNTFSINPKPQPNPHPRRAAANPKTAVDGDHPPLFHCSCFRCYMSYWARWDSSPNHQLIHEIIDSYEDWLAAQSTKPSNKKKDKRNKNKSPHSNRPEAAPSPRVPSDDSDSVGETSSGGGGGGDGDEEEVGGEGGVEAEEKGSVRRFVSWIWGGWGQ